MEKKLNFLQHNVIVGSLLGDLHIQKTTSTTEKCRLRFCHSMKQKEYVDWKYLVFQKQFCVNTKLPSKTVRNFDNFKKNGEYVFYTEYSKEFLHYHSTWYKKNSTLKNYKKILPINIRDLLVDPIALAIWYLDDGTKRLDCESCRFATQSFSEEENLLLQECLQANFHLYSTIDKWWQKKSEKFLYGLSIPRRSYKDFKFLIFDCVQTEIPSMLYKLQ